MEYSEKNGVLPLEKFYIYFSPYTSHAIEVDGVVYPTVEHAYQCMRYNDAKIVEKIRSARSPVVAWEISESFKPVFEHEKYFIDFRKNKREIMKRLMRLKALQHNEVKKALIDSKDLKIIKHVTTYPPGDGFWDDGERGDGQNEIGKIWMEIRDEIKQS